MNIINAIIRFLKVVITLATIEAFAFFLMIFFVMTDESPHPLGDFFYFIIKYICGFPLVLFNESYPFFLESWDTPDYWIALAFCNIALQAILIMFLSKYFFNLIGNLKKIIIPSSHYDDE